MQYFRRFEFKYVLAQTIAPVLYKHLLKANMVADAHGASYPVTSLYFDSPRLEDYADKAGGFLKRKKVRVRIYTPTLTDNTKEIWLEEKMKFEMKISKKRVLLTRKNYDELTAGSRLSLYRTLYKEKHEHVESIFASLTRGNMKPHIIVRYNRAPLISQKYSDLRITFDQNIEACQNGDLSYTRFMRPVAPGKTIMEVKFSTFLPPWFKDFLRQYELTRESFSKYANSVEVLYRHHPIPR